MLRRSAAVVALVLGLVSGNALPAGAQSPPASLAPGAVVALAGTPHLWVAGDDALLHWAGDTRALAGKRVDWGNRREVGLDELRQLRRGAPWLSAGLLKSGDPIYFVKWESDWAEPQLLHIQSIEDVQLFGIDGTNYGQMVLAEASWESRHGMAVVRLKKGVLASAARAGTAAAAPAAPARGLLARAISPAERAAFLASAAGMAGAKGKVTRWDEPIRVQLRQSSYPVHSQIVDSMVAEAQDLLGGHPISRVTSGGNVVVDFVPLAQIEGGSDGLLGSATYKYKASGALRQCVIEVAQDPETLFGSLARHISPQMQSDLLGLVIRHEFGHCLGLGHNASPESFMSYSYDPWDRYYTKGARNARFPDFDRALIRTLYHSGVRVGMSLADLGELFAS